MMEGLNFDKPLRAELRLAVSYLSPEKSKECGVRLTAKSSLAGTN
jgi:hypothetical protein